MYRVAITRTPKKPHPPRNHHRRSIVMYDSVDLSTIPRRPQAVALYRHGNSFINWDEGVKRFPHAHHLSITLDAAYDDDCLDMEPGGANYAQFGEWCIRQHKRGLRRPVGYASIDNMPLVLASMRSHGIRRTQVRLWAAHYTGVKTREQVSGYYVDAEQWTDNALGRNLDESICRPDFFD